MIAEIGRPKRWLKMMDVPVTPPMMKVLMAKAQSRFPSVMSATVCKCFIKVVLAYFQKIKCLFIAV